MSWAVPKNTCSQYNLTMKNLYLPVLVLLCYYSGWGQPSHPDCPDALVLCDKTPIVVEALPDGGANTAEVGITSCFSQNFPETNSTWFQWTVEKAGTLEFTILPLNEQDDIDFVVYRLPGSAQNCIDKQEVRCMLAGPVLGEESPADQACLGATGLTAGADYFSEGRGCADGASNFLSVLDVLPGESYLLFVNNFRSPMGFLLEFGGTCTFRPVPGPCKTTKAPVLHNFTKQIIVSGVQPNPATEEARIQLQASEGFAGTLIMADVHGRILETRPIEVAPGDNTVPLNVRTLSPGVYFVKMRFGDRVYLSRFYKG